MPRKKSALHQKKSAPLLLLSKKEREECQHPSPAPSFPFPLKEGSAPTPERRECTHPWKEGSLPAHHPTVAWFVRHCAWLHDRFVMKRQDKQTVFQTSSPFFETVPWREPGLHVFNFKGKWGVSIWTGRDNLAVMHNILTRQGVLSARSIRRFAPSEAADQQILLTAKGHPGRLKAMTDEQEVLVLPPTQSSTPICESPQQRRTQQNQHLQRQQEERKRVVRKSSQRRR